VLIGVLGELVGDPLGATFPGVEVAVPGVGRPRVAAPVGIVAGEPVVLGVMKMVGPGGTERPPKGSPGDGVRRAIAGPAPSSPIASPTIKPTVRTLRRGMVSRVSASHDDRGTVAEQTLVRGDPDSGSLDLTTGCLAA
jgi:hypothetical protein